MAMLIGRERPAAVLRGEVERALASHGALVLVTGEAGIGKSALVASAAQEAVRGAPGSSPAPAGRARARRATGRGCRWSGSSPPGPRRRAWQGPRRRRSSSTTR
ncbi:ATP-binding protein [Nonomuraea thailandensis]